MADRKRFLARGFFPKELPPAFQSGEYASAIETSGYAPPGFPPLPKSALSYHSLARAGSVRRLLAIPNPISHLRLADEISKGWSDISEHISSSTIGVSRPILRGTMGRAAAPRLRFGALPRLRVTSRRHGRYVLLADTAEYYRTVYTHSIPWALHTKALAHQPANHKNYSLLGVRIDRALRNCQSLQTNGIPVGPDTSFVIGEIVLAAVDLEIMKTIRPLSAWRFYDDYELVFEKYSDAEEALALIHAALGEYNLQLNAHKTGIYSLPLRLDSPWRDFIRRYEFGVSDEAKQRSLLGYFDLVFSLKQQYPNDPLVGYAISRLESLPLEVGTWTTLQEFLLQTMSVEPDSMQQVAVMFAKAHAEGHTVSREELGHGIGLILAQHAFQGHGSEVAWALWMALSFSCRVEHPTALLALQKMNDSVVALLALDANDRGLLPGLDLSYWSSLMTPAALYGAHWLLSYEARVRNWLGTAGGGDHVAGDPAFNFLRSNSVHFYKRVRSPTRRSTSLIPNWRPAYGVTDLLV
jgi:hypothetical protein